MNYDMTEPCSNCPFRNDRPGYLTPARAREIAKSITVDQASFPCHKTTVAVEDEHGNSDSEVTPDSQHCGGALIFLEKLNQPNQMMRIAERMGWYDASKLNMKAPVVDSIREFVGLQKSRR